MSKVEFILSFISSDGLFWYVNRTSVHKNFEFNVFNDTNLLEQFLLNYQMVYQEQIYITLLNHVDNQCWQCYNELILLL